MDKAKRDSPANCPGWIDASTTIPKAGLRVLYRTQAYQAIGYVSESGEWFSSSGRREVNRVIRWQDL